MIIYIIRIKSDLDKDAFTKKLRDNVGDAHYNKWTDHFYGKGKIIGWLEDKSFSLITNSKLFDFAQPVFKGKFIEGNDCNYIKGYFYLNPFMLIFYTLIVFISYPFSDFSGMDILIIIAFVLLLFRSIKDVRTLNRFIQHIAAENTSSE